MATSLFLKTIIILSSQIGIVFVGAYLIIRKLRKATLEGSTWMGTQLIESYNSRGELDLLPVKKRNPETGEVILSYYVKSTESKLFKPSIVELTPRQLEVAEKDPDTGKPVFWVATKDVKNFKEGTKYKICSEESVDTPEWFLVFIGIWVPLLFFSAWGAGSGGLGVGFGLPLMTAVSLAFAPILAWILILMDENDGIRVLWLTVAITIVCGIVGTTSGIDFSFLDIPLLIGLFGLCILRIYQSLNGLTAVKTRMMAILGCILFTLFLLFDFYRLADLNEIAEENNWDVAFQLAFHLYLDIINLLLELLQAMGS
tara:strand:+ start:957 stop:1898 length:942 start_codon:yes stop_codon:yes gene_type:complete